MSIINVENLCVSYDTGTVLENINFSVDKGDYLCIVGENGSGKSTLVKALLGLLKIRKGKIEFKEGLSGKDIGYLPQSFHSQKDFPASVGEIVLSGTLNKRGLRPFYSAKEKDLAHSCMHQLGICDLSKKCFNELSGGQQQRVLLARALCASGKLLLLDEPVTALDPDASEDFYRLVKQLNNEKKITVIMITHDLSKAMEYSNKILHLSFGKSFFGTKEEYLETFPNTRKGG